MAACWRVKIYDNKFETQSKRNKNRPEGGTRNRKRDKEGWGDEEGAESEGKRNRRKKNQNLTETEYENDEYTDDSDTYQADYSLGDLSEYVGTVDYVTAKVQFRKILKISSK